MYTFHQTVENGRPHRRRPLYTVRPRNCRRRLFDTQTVKDDRPHHNPPHIQCPNEPVDVDSSTRKLFRTAALPTTLLIHSSPKKLSIDSSTRKLFRAKALAWPPIAGSSSGRTVNFRWVRRQSIRCKETTGKIYSLRPPRRTPMRPPRGGLPGTRRKIYNLPSLEGSDRPSSSTPH